jgi:hypothetical protein
MRAKRRALAASQRDLITVRKDAVGDVQNDEAEIGAITTATGGQLEPAQGKLESGIQDSPKDAPKVPAEPAPDPATAAKKSDDLSFQEGDTGAGVLQTHETGLTKVQVDMTDSFGWSPTTFTDDEMGDLAKAAGLEPAALSELIAKAQGGDAQPLAGAMDAMVHPRRWDRLTETQKSLVARACPVEIHTDIRLRKAKDDHWEGGEGLTPGNQFAENAFRAPAPSVVVGIDKSNPEAPAVVRGPVAWMNVGVTKAQAFEPGQPGSPPSSWSRFHVRDQFTFAVGKCQADEVEFLFDGETVNGRWLAKRHPDGWTFEQATDQAFASQELREKALRKGVFCPIAKADTERRLVTGMVLVPETVDAQGDIISAEAIELAAHDFLARYNRETELGVQHNSFNGQAELVESFLAPISYPLEGRTILQGTWMITVHVTDDETWEKVKTGAIAGFSIGGTAKVRRLTPG